MSSQPAQAKQIRQIAEFSEVATRWTYSDLAQSQLPTKLGFVIDEHSRGGTTHGSR